MWVAKSALAADSPKIKQLASTQLESSLASWLFNCRGRRKNFAQNSPSQFLLAGGRRQTCRCPVLLEMEDAPGLGWSGVTPHKQTFSGRVEWPRHTSSERPCVTGFGHQLGRYRKDANLRRRTYHKKIQKKHRFFPFFIHCIHIFVARCTAWIEASRKMDTVRVGHSSPCYLLATRVCAHGDE